MKRTNQANTIMAELMIVILFFAIAATVLIQVFVAAGNLSSKADAECRALPEAQNIRDSIYAAENAEEVLQSLGFSETEGNTWERTDGDCAYGVVISYEQNTAGTLRRAEVTASYKNEELLRLSATAYIAGGEQP